MDRATAATMVRAACLLLVSIFYGCATPSSTPGQVDSVRLVNAIVADDAGYVRDAVASGTISVNQHVPAPAYMEGTPLITIAARAGALNVLRYLISAGADVNGRTPAGETALMLAAYFHEGGWFSGGRHEEAVRLLIAARADLENERYHYTALAYAAYKGHERIVRFLLDRGARVNADAEHGVSYVNTPLMMASMQGHQSTALMLLQAGADPRVRVVGGLTARELAAKYQHASLARTLACAERATLGELSAARCE